MFGAEGPPQGALFAARGGPLSLPAKGAPYPRHGERPSVKRGPLRGKRAPLWKREPF